MANHGRVTPADAPIRRESPLQIAIQFTRRRTDLGKDLISSFATDRTGPGKRRPNILIETGSVPKLNLGVEQSKVTGVQAPA